MDNTRISPLRLLLLSGYETLVAAEEHRATLAHTLERTPRMVRVVVEPEWVGTSRPFYGIYAVPAPGYEGDRPNMSAAEALRNVVLHGFCNPLVHGQMTDNRLPPAEE